MLARGYDDARYFVSNYSDGCGCSSLKGNRKDGKVSLLIELYANDAMRQDDNILAVDFLSTTIRLSNQRHYNKFTGELKDE